ncbi:hypothetical protein BC833DRAFT_620528 [Globomyces pollinis-pini]|nr:hypothetical protein BC833DRAFT_620528 [Globomyces pollinis-pini]
MLAFCLFAFINVLADCSSISCGPGLKCLSLPEGTDCVQQHYPFCSSSLDCNFRSVPETCIAGNCVPKSGNKQCSVGCIDPNYECTSNLCSLKAGHCNSTSTCPGLQKCLVVPTTSANYPGSALCSEIEYREPINWVYVGLGIILFLCVVISCIYKFYSNKRVDKFKDHS